MMQVDEIIEVLIMKLLNSSIQVILQVVHFIYERISCEYGRKAFLGKIMNIGSSDL